MKKARHKQQMLNAIMLTTFLILPINQVNAAINEYGKGDSSKYYQLKLDEYGVNKLEEVKSSTSGTTYKVNYDSNNSYTDLNVRPWSNISTGEDTDLLNADFLNNGIDEIIRAEVRGGAIYNRYTINNITSNFFGNHIIQQAAYYSAMGGTIGNVNGGEIGSIDGILSGIS